MEIVYKILALAVVLIIIEIVYLKYVNYKFYQIIGRLRVDISLRIKPETQKSELCKNRMELASELIDEWEIDYKKIRLFKSVVFDRLELLSEFIKKTSEYDKRLSYCRPHNFPGINEIKAETLHLIWEINALDTKETLSDRQSKLRREARAVAAKANITSPTEYKEARKLFIDLMCFRMDIDYFELFA